MRWQRVAALCIHLPETQVLLDDVKVDRQGSVFEAISAEGWDVMEARPPGYQ